MTTLNRAAAKNISANDPVIIPTNYDALITMSWFMSDANGLNNWGNQLFGCDIDVNSKTMMDIKNGILKIIAEIKDDINSIEENLKAYTPTTNSR